MSTLLFIKNSLKDFRRIGAVSPSSRFLARRMARAGLSRGAKNVAELGAGTGVITREILKKLPEDGHLSVFEANNEFVDYLEREVQHSRIRLYRSDAREIAEVMGEKTVDAVISGLPLGNLGRRASEKILFQIARALKPDGVFVQFQYSLISYRVIKRHFAGVKILFEPRNIWPAFIYVCRKQ